MAVHAPRASALPARSLRLRFQHRLLNPLVRALLRSPLHGLLSGSVMLLTYTGRRTGLPHTIPVMYAADGEALVVFVGWPDRKVWWRNLADGQHVSVLVRGDELRARARLVTDTAESQRCLAVYLARYPRAAGRRAGAAASHDAGPTVLVRVEPER